MPRILTIGIATLDLIFGVDHYPHEDEEMRAQNLRVVRGGNASNTAVVLSQLGHQVSFAGVLADAPENQILLEDFRRFRVDVSHCVTRPGKPPTSSILLAPSGSRTIVHYRDLPEFCFEDFARIDLADFDWVHFEGRNIPELAQMLAHARKARPNLKISLEAEKPRDGLDAMLGLPDLLLCSRALAQHLGHTEAAPFLHAMRAKAPQAAIFVGWGSHGAFALDSENRIHENPAFPPARVVDSVGAGDTFNAGVIDGCVRGLRTEETLSAASQLAGRKCGLAGFALV
jgi:ketohexokinase